MAWPVRSPCAPSIRPTALACALRVRLFSVRPGPCPLLALPLERASSGGHCGIASFFYFFKFYLLVAAVDATRAGSWSLVYLAPGSSARISASGCSPGRRALRRQLLHRRRANIAHLEATRFELMRHDVTFPLYVEVDEIYNLACPAPRCTTSSTRSRRRRPACTAPSTCSASPSGVKAKILQASTSEVYGDPRCTRRPRTTGATSTRSARAPATTRASAAPRRCSSTTTASTAAHQGGAHLQHLRPAHAPERWPRGVELHRAGAAGRADHDLRRRQQTRSSATSTT